MRTRSRNVRILADSKPLRLRLLWSDLNKDLKVRRSEFRSWARWPYNPNAVRLGLDEFGWKRKAGRVHRGGDRPVLLPRECRPDRRRRAAGSGNLCHSSHEKRSVCRDNITGGICVAPPQDVRSARGRSKLPSRAASSAGDKTVKPGAIEMNIITKYVSRRWFLWK